jgi:hypothetical protein
MWEEAIGVVILVTHFLVIGAIILWFGLGKPKTLALFWSECRRNFLRW